jgi:hypothetical protein
VFHQRQGAAAGLELTIMTTELPLQVELAATGARFTPLGLELPETMPIEGWAEVGRRLWRTDQVMQWWLGDWAAFGLRKYDEERRKEFKVQGPKSKDQPPRITLKEFAAANSINYQTLQNLSWVSRSVPISRRRENLEWSKHAEVAALKPREQVQWLDKMEKENLPRSAVRQQIRLSQGENNALQSDGPVTKFGLKAADDLAYWLKSRPAEFWSPDRCAEVRQRLEPIAKFYERLA